MLYNNLNIYLRIRNCQIYGKKTNGKKTRIFKACLDSIFLFNVELWTRPYQIWSKLSDLRQTFPKVVSSVQSNTCEISGQLKKSLRRFTSHLWFGPTEGLIFHYFWLYLENRSTYKVAKPLKMCRIAILGMVATKIGPLECIVLEI